jgi:hypothetical protein
MMQGNVRQGKRQARKLNNCAFEEALIFLESSPSNGFQIKIDPVNPTDRSDFENMMSDMSLNPVLRQKLL